MTWLVWRRQRVALLIAAVLVAATIVALVAGRLALEARAASLGAGDCLSDATLNCTTSVGGQELEGSFRLFHLYLRFWLWALAPLLGLIVAAALFARETEERTVVFALTQSVSRARWWTTNIAATLLPAVAGALLLALAASWALAPFSVLYRQSRVEPLDFEVQGIWPFAAVLVTFSLAALFGTLLRSSLPVIVVTVLGWLVVYASLLYTRYDTLPPAVLAIPISQYTGEFDINGMPGELVYRDATGSTIPLRTVGQDCGPREDYIACLEHSGVVTAELQYQPDSNFWPLQGIQSGIATALSAALLAGSYARARRLG